MTKVGTQKVLVEICVDTFEGCLVAVEGGADRIELCASLSEGGLTPSAGLMKQAADLPIPVYAMIRPRSGLFHFSDAEVDIMRRDIQAAGESGLDGVVLGVQTTQNTLDTETLQLLCEEASEMGKTLHRVIDVLDDPMNAVRTAIDLGFDRILTSGAKPFATDGIDLISQMVAAADKAISIMPGCGLDHENVYDLVTSTGTREVHAACRVLVPGARSFSDFDPPGGRFATSNELVRLMVEAVSDS